MTDNPNAAKPTTVRFSPDELELIDAAADALSVDSGFKVSRSDLLRRALKLMKPPDKLTEKHARWRRAYTTVFRSEP